MLKSVQRSLLPAALLSALVGLAGCHVSFGSGSSSQSPNSTSRGKPAKKSPRTATPTKSTTKPVNSTSSKQVSPASTPAADETTDPQRNQTEPTDPQRKTSTDPQRTKPSTEPGDPARTNRHLNRVPGGEGGDEDEGSTTPGANTRDRPGSVTAPTNDEGPKEVVRPGSVTTPPKKTAGANEATRPSTVVAPR